MPSHKMLSPKFKWQRESICIRDSTLHPISDQRTTSAQVKLDKQVAAPMILTNSFEKFRQETVSIAEISESYTLIQF